MNLEKQEALLVLDESIVEFLETFVEEEEYDDNEYEFLSDESGISNTKTDNLIKLLESTRELVSELSAAE